MKPLSLFVFSFILWCTDSPAQIRFVWPLGCNTCVMHTFCEAGGLLYVNHDGQLWSTDGTTTSPLGKFETLLYGHHEVLGMTDYNNALYFFGAYNFMTSDGTKAGTLPVSSVETHICKAGDYSVRTLNNKMYFVGRSASSPTALWESDGTTPGTQSTGIGNLYLSHSNFSFEKVGNKLFIAGDSGLIVTNGTPTGTITIGGIYYADEFISYNGQLIFSGNDNNSDDVYISDGTIAGTQKILNNVTLLADHAELNGKLYFHCTDKATNISALYVTDGTPAGTSKIKDGMLGNKFSPMMCTAYDHESIYLTTYNNKLYFMGPDHELWESDGTTAGTKLFLDLTPYTYQGTTFKSRPMYMQVMAAKLAFIASDTLRSDVWVTDGTAQGTINLTNKSIGNPIGPLHYYKNEIYTITQEGDLYAIGNNSITGINNVTSTADIEISPNPSEGIFSWADKAGNYNKAIVYDIMGREVFQTVLNSGTDKKIDIRHLAQGNYVLKLSGTDKAISKKIIIVP